MRFPINVNISKYIDIAAKQRAVSRNILELYDMNALFLTCTEKKYMSVWDTTNTPERIGLHFNLELNGHDEDLFG